jgi:hypothetical protein
MQYQAQALLPMFLQQVLLVAACCAAQRPAAAVHAHLLLGTYQGLCHHMSHMGPCREAHAVSHMLQETPARVYVTGASTPLQDLTA